MLPKIIAFIISFSTVCWSLQAQHQDVFPSQSGSELLTSLVDYYKPEGPFFYGVARDSLFAKVYAHNDSLTCVYTGFTIYLDPSQDPTTAAYMNDGPDGINTEHTFPQSKGAGSGNARADMHHLYATRIDVNADRASLPFAEVSDNQTDTWYYWNQSQSNTPTQNIEWYSELNENSAFEPREDHKGNVARSMFYFYTMYKTEADNADGNFFSSQQATLCDWHYSDPVDPLEWDRSYLIAHFQDDKPNPFVLDCTLAARTYCESYIGTPCITAIDKGLEIPPPFELKQNAPNPFSEKTSISYSLHEAFEVELSLYNAFGQKLATLVNARQAAGDYVLDFNVENAVGATKGSLLFYRIQLTNGEKTYRAVKKMIMQ